MARLDSKSDTQLIYLAGSLIERLNDSMRGNNRISRENDANKGLRLDANTYTNRQSVVIRSGQEGIINQFMTLVGQRNKTLAVNLDLETSDPNNKKIKFGSLSAPSVPRYNLGDIAEAVFAAALAARFTKRSQFATSSEDVKNILRRLSVGGQSATFLGSAPNLNFPASDTIRLRLRLTELAMNFITNPNNLESLSQYINASIQYADRQSVKNWVKTIYTNRRVDTVEITADGISAAKSSKIDVKVKITNNTGVLSGVNINASVKTDEIPQFGQVSGRSFDAVSRFFSTTIRENLSENASEFERKSSDGREQMRYIYQQAFIKLQQKLNSNPRSMNFIIGTGIKQFATQDNAGVVDDNGNTVELIDLTRGEATIFDFKNVASKLSDVRLDAEYGVGGRSNLPTISILDADSRKLLIQLRSKVENKIGRDGPYLYYRNYIEKGPFLTELIGRSANENPVTSS